MNIIINILVLLSGTLLGSFIGIGIGRAVWTLIVKPYLYRKEEPGYKYERGSIRKIIIDPSDAFMPSDLGFYVTVVPYKGRVKQYHIWDYEIKDVLKKLKEKRMVK